MLRYFFIFILVIGFVSSLAGQRGARSSSARDSIIEEVKADQDRGYAGAQAASEPQFSQNSDGSVEIERSGDGHFYADVQINGAPVRMLVDTGASVVALSRDDARSAGVATSIGMNDVVGEGADGAVRGEYVTLGRVELGGKSAERLEAIVLNAGEQSLLGQSFLSQFSVSIEGDKMVLR